MKQSASSRAGESGRREPPQERQYAFASPKVGPGSHPWDPYVRMWIWKGAEVREIGLHKEKRKEICARIASDGYLTRWCCRSCRRR